MSTIESYITSARAQGASDLHLESGIPPALRVRGKLSFMGTPPVSQASLIEITRRLLGEQNWPVFLEQKSFDLSKTVSGIRCRFNVLITSRGIGLAIRLLMPFQATVEKLNLHSDLKEIVHFPHGLVLICGPTGSGKSSTMAALVEEINVTSARHIVAIENPIEYYFKSRLSLIRQREVGRDTPSFYQALVDALREDPDVLVVGEMRETETMRLTINAAETGHLVFSTVHSSSVGEALQRVVSAFPAEAQDGVKSQLSSSLSAVVCQRLVYRPELKIRVPECEIMFMNSAIKSLIREGKFFKVNDVIQTSASEKMWTFGRYRGWLETKNNWHLPSDQDAYDVGSEAEPVSLSLATKTTPQPAVSISKKLASNSIGRQNVKKDISHESQHHHHDHIIEIDEEENLDDLIKKLDK